MLEKLENLVERGRGEVCAEVCIIDWEDRVFSIAVHRLVIQEPEDVRLRRAIDRTYKHDTRTRLNFHDLLVGRLEQDDLGRTLCRMSNRFILQFKI